MKIDLLKYWDAKQLYYIPELCSKIIKGMQRDGKVLLYTYEDKNPENNGLYKLLDELCIYHRWDKSNITIACVNPGLHHDEYDTMFLDFSPPAQYLPITDTVLPWNKEKSYGMFIGRPDVSRVRALHQHVNFKFKDRGLTSFHGNLLVEFNSADLLEYLTSSNQPYNEVVNIQPYSDIDKILTTPIWAASNTKPNFWSGVYEKIAIEVVCETGPDVDNFSFTEKILRPMYFKRPFLVAGAPGYIKFLKKCGFKTFDRIISEEYDNHHGIYRVDMMFSQLNSLLANNRLEELLTEYAEVLEHNHNRVLEWREEKGITYEDFNRYIISIPGYDHGKK